MEVEVLEVVKDSINEEAYFENGKHDITLISPCNEIGNQNDINK